VTIDGQLNQASSVKCREKKLEPNIGTRLTGVRYL